MKIIYGEACESRLKDMDRLINNTAAGLHTITEPVEFLAKVIMRLTENSEKHKFIPRYIKV